MSTSPPETTPAFSRDRSTDLLLFGTDLIKRVTLYNYTAFLKASASSPKLLQSLSPQAALRSAEHAYRTVPAFKRHLDGHGWSDDPTLSPADRIRRIPQMDKAGYVKAYSTEERCVGGCIPMNGTEIDESSGSSGTPFNWVRSRKELEELHRAMGQYARMFFGNNVITINGFSMGAWATGVNVGEALRRIGIVKSTGPDVDKILNTLKFFGPKYTYVLTGYPPFLKHLIDEGEAAGIDWSSTRAFGIVGGEGMSEGLRAYLESRLISVYSCYGASDLDIGVGAEVPLSIWIRKKAAANPDLQRALFGNDSRLPMLFQYNPLDYYIETNDERELIVTVNRMSLLSPRIRYNIHDAGGVMTYNEMIGVLREFNLDPLPDLQRMGAPIFRLPFLYLLGRSDSTMSYMGANIYPEDVQGALFANTDDARFLNSFCMELIDVGNGEQRPCIHVEMADGKADDGALGERLRQRVLDRLLATNLDFRSSVHEDASAGDIRIKMHGKLQGPFAANAGRIKQRYIVSSAPKAP
ncbi:MAG: phenylacetate--CoA ligase family protein [Chloroflexota bacterium]